MFFAKLSMAGTPIVFNIFFCNLSLSTQKWQNYSLFIDRLKSHLIRPLKSDLFVALILLAAHDISTTIS
jgi:hypothetical protein